MKDKLSKHVVIFNKVRKYSLFNAYYTIHKYAESDEAVILNLDGDDWLINSDVLSYLSSCYSQFQCRFTYGECVFWDGKKQSKSSRFVKPFTNIVYPPEVVAEKQYRKYPFLPLHPRSWKAGLFKKIKKEDFLRADGSWLQFAEDQAIFYPMLEMAINKLKVIQRPLYVYNIAAKNADVKENLKNVLKDELTIRRKKIYETAY